MVSQINNTQGNNSILSKAKNKTKKDSKFLDMFENLGKTKKIDPKKPISNLSPPTPKSLQKNENLIKQDTNLLSNLLNKENPKIIKTAAGEENIPPMDLQDLESTNNMENPKNKVLNAGKEKKIGEKNLEGKIDSNKGKIEEKLEEKGKLDEKGKENTKLEKPKEKENIQNKVGEKIEGKEGKIEGDISLKLDSKEIEKGSEKNIEENLNNLQKEEKDKNEEKGKENIQNKVGEKIEGKEGKLDSNEGNKGKVEEKLGEKGKLDEKGKEGNTPPLSLKNTLKYGAFSGFDALSLLKPSNGKKLSELIKKADELALNLEKLKYQSSKNITKETKETNNEIQIKNETLKEKLSPLENNLENKKEQNPPLNGVKERNEGKENPPLETKENSKNKVEGKVEGKEEIKEKKPDGVDSKQTKIEGKVEGNEGRGKENLKLEGKLTNEGKENLSSNLDSNKLDIENPLSEKNDFGEKTQGKVTPASLKIEKNKKDEITKNAKSDEIKEKSEISNIENKQMQKNYESKETIKNLVHQIQKEITNYKPPMQRITLELSPANLGNVEVVITHQGKNIQVQLQGNQNTLNLLIQNNAELRNALSSIGYENVSMSFSNGNSMGFSDRNGNWQWEKIEKNGNENSLEKEEEMANLEIMIINNYA